MPVREILKYPHPVLRQKAAPVTAFDNALKELIADMIETMHNARGAGLAANQVGVTLQVVVIDIARPPAEPHPIVLINPQVLKGEGSDVNEEGCLSLVEFNADIKRFWRVWVRAQDMDGATREFETEDLLARVIQHEVDHLNGILCLDHVSTLKRALYKKKRKKQLAQKNTSD